MIQIFVQKINYIDGVLFYKMYPIQSRRILINIFRLFSKSAGGYLYFILAIFALFANFTKGLNIVSIAALSFLLELPLYWIVKHSIKRPRPFDKNKTIVFLVIPPDKFSFPSGHTAGAFLVATILSVFFLKLSMVFFLWATLVGISRIVLGVHYPTDVAAGALLGVVSAVFGLILI